LIKRLTLQSLPLISSRAISYKYHFTIHKETFINRPYLSITH
jgi:hypothetical protein